ncbi:MAG: transcriptional regulator [Candidatus Thermoplasmatota archaeon]|nr:transcriptional regulator [Candidatus Thermoplasmatota archaeon]
MEDFRKFLLKELMVQLRNRGLEFAEPDLDGVSTFDIAARRGDEKYLIKILYNIDTMREEGARDLMSVSRILGCIAIVIGNRASNGTLEDGIIYFRHEVPIMTYETYIAYLDGESPYIFSAHGGYYVSINGESLRKIREEHRYSIGYVSGAVGVSRRSISLYESGSAATLDVFNRLQRIFAVDLKKRINLMKHLEEMPVDENHDLFINEFYSAVLQLMKSIGFSMYPFRKTPFDAMATDVTADQIIMGLADELNNYRKARAIASLSELFENYAMVVTKANTEKRTIAGVPVIRKDDIVNAGDKESLVNLLRKKADNR